MLCRDCLERLPRADGERCDRCWLPLGHAESCRACETRELAVERLRSVFRYEGPVRRLVGSFKFRGHSALAPPLGALLLDCYDIEGLSADVVAPVPLTGRRQRTRGYNQARLLAEVVGRGAGLMLVEDLVRKQAARTQANSDSAEQRWANVKDAFGVKSGEPIAGRTVLLIDDVATTGATLDACARVLLAAGASRVQALTLARED